MRKLAPTKRMIGEVMKPGVVYQGTILWKRQFFKEEYVC
jgi:hypothetical protein